MQNLPRRGQDSSEPRPSCMKMSHPSEACNICIFVVVVYPIVHFLPSIHQASVPQNRPVIVPGWKLCKSCRLFCSYSNYRIVRRSFDIFCVYHVVGTVGICACMDSAQAYAAGIHLQIRLSTLPSGSSKYLLYPISSEAYLSIPMWAYGYRLTQLYLTCPWTGKAKDTAAT